VFSNLAGYGPVDWFFYVLLAGAFLVEAFAFIDALRHRADAYIAASKQTKPLWLIILGVALVIGFGGITQEVGLFSFLALPIIAFVAAAIYLADVRPKLKTVRQNSGQRQGPYGPW
jgi:hypothetical protein